MTYDTFFKPKKRDWEIIISDFILFFGQLKHLHLSEKNHNAFLNTTCSTKTEAKQIFKYQKNNSWYWNKPKLWKQTVEKIILIVKVFYPGYFFFLIFSNMISQVFNINYTQYTRDINKNLRGKQNFLKNNWSEIEDIYYTY